MSNRLSAPETQTTPYDQPEFDALQPQQWPDQWRPSDEFPTPQSVSSDAFSQVIDDGLHFSAARQPYRLGAAHLTVAPYRELILDTTDASQTTILSSETGTGKTSQAGLYHLEHGRDRIFVSAPRIVAARKSYEWAKLGLGPDYGHLAGYMTGMASDSDHDELKRHTNITEQLLFKIANRGGLRNGDMVIADEVHEGNSATSALLGVMHEIMQDYPDIKLLIASATMDCNKYAQVFIDAKTGKPAPILVLPGRMHQVDISESYESVAAVARQQMALGRNVLGFEPGESRQKSTAAAMSSRNREHTVSILNGDQSPAEQEKALSPEDKHHIVSSRIGEASITPENKDSVVDSGLSNEGMYEQGKRVLATIFSSQATMIQRAGRVARTREGFVVRAQPDNAPPSPAFEDRDEYDTPPMQISSVTSFITERLRMDKRFEDMALVDQPTAENLAHDYRVLRRLGAIATVEGKLVLTDVGRSMTDLNLDASLARMVIEARNITDHYDVDGDAVRLQVAAIAAINTVHGIVNASMASKRRYLLSQRHEENLSNEHMSDVIFSLDVLVKLRAKQLKIEASGTGDPTQRFEKYLKDKDILPNRYIKAFRTFEELCLREGLDIDQLRSPDAEERKAIIGCQIAGTDELFVQKSKAIHTDIRGESRRLGRRSTINPALAKLVIGTAFDYRGLGAAGRFERRFIADSSVVSTEQLLQHAPDRITRMGRGHAVAQDGKIVERQGLYFDGEVMFGEVNAEPLPTIDTREFVIRAMMTGIAQSAKNPDQTVDYDPGTPNAERARQQWERAQQLDHRSLANLRTGERYDRLIRKIARDSIGQVPLDVVDPVVLDEVIPRVFMGSLVRPSRRRDVPEIIRRSPDAISVHAGEDKKHYLPITYRNNIAYITIPRDHSLTAIMRSDFAELAKHHPIKFRMGSRPYQQADAFFRQIDVQLNAPKRLKRIQRREEQAAKESTPESHQAALERLTTGRKEPLPMSNNLPIVVRSQTHTRRQRRERGGGRRDLKDPKTTTS